MSKQYFVKMQTKIEGDNFINLLEASGYRNVHDISYNDLKIKVIAVDKDSFWGVNVTSLACATSCGIKCISVDEFLNIVDLNSNEVGLN